MAEETEFNLLEGESKSERIRKMTKNAAQRASFDEYMAQQPKSGRLEVGTRIPSARIAAAPEPQAAVSAGGADLDAAINALNARVDDHEARIAALEEGGEDTGGPPDPPDPPEPPSGKRYPTGLDDPSVGVPAGTSLKASGSISSSRDGQVWEGLDISGTVTITHRNCKLLKSRVRSSAYNLVKTRVNKDTEIAYCTIEATGNTGSNGIDGVAYIHHNKITGAENCINVAGNGALIEWNAFGKMGGVQGVAHYDCIQADGSIDGLIIQNNYIDNDKGDTSATMIDNYWGPIKNVTIKNNFLGGGGMPAYLDGSFKGSANATNIVYEDNDMRRGGYDYFYWKQAGSGCVHRRNKDWKTGAAID